MAEAGVYEDRREGERGGKERGEGKREGRERGGEGRREGREGERGGKERGEGRREGRDERGGKECISGKECTKKALGTQCFRAT